MKIKFNKYSMTHEYKLKVRVTNPKLIILFT